MSDCIANSDSGIPERDKLIERVLTFQKDEYPLRYNDPMKEPKPKYQIRIDQQGKYEWTAQLADMIVEPPSATTVMAKSLHELMAKVLVAVTLRDVNAGVPETVEIKPPENNGDHPKILAPSRRIITN